MCHLCIYTNLQIKNSEQNCKIGKKKTLLLCVFIAYVIKLVYIEMFKAQY